MIHIHHLTESTSKENPCKYNVTLFGNTVGNPLDNVMSDLLSNMVGNPLDNVMNDLLSDMVGNPQRIFSLLPNMEGDPHLPFDRDHFQRISCKCNEVRSNYCEARPNYSFLEKAPRSRTVGKVLCVIGTFRTVRLLTAG